MSEKTQAEILKDELCLKKEHFEFFSPEETEKCDEFCSGYMEFLGTAKTERECNVYLIEKAKNEGFKPFSPYERYNAGDKVYLDNRGKALILAVIAVCIAAAGHSAQTLRVSLLEAYTQKDGNRQNQHCRTEDIGCYH